MNIMGLGIRPVAIFVKKDKTVDVLLDCNNIGQALIKVEINADGVMSADIANANELNWNVLESFETYINSRIAVRQSGLKTLQHFVSFGSEWTIVGQDKDFDMFSLKRNLPGNILEESSTYKPRFSLFGANSKV
ncbi:MAG: hypothetical protein KF802_02450 [Bdellovibrionaceae bacterium]|nr:hypothetical protein [Pseudobdellovibrionaceae bacterium]